MKVNRTLAGIAVVIGTMFATCSQAADKTPRYPFRVAGVCPFECCQYGKWIAEEDIKILAKERTSTPAFTIKAGQTFVAEGGSALAGTSATVTSASVHPIAAPD